MNTNRITFCTSREAILSLGSCLDYGFVIGKLKRVNKRFKEILSDPAFLDRLWKDTWVRHRVNLRSVSIVLLDDRDPQVLRARGMRFAKAMANVGKRSFGKSYREIPTRIQPTFLHDRLMTLDANNGFLFGNDFAANPVSFHKVVEPKLMAGDGIGNLVIYQKDKLVGHSSTKLLDVWEIDIDKLRPPTQLALSFYNLAVVTEWGINLWNAVPKDTKPGVVFKQPRPQQLCCELADTICFSGVNRDKESISCWDIPTATRIVNFGKEACHEIVSDGPWVVSRHLDTVHLWDTRDLRRPISTNKDPDLLVTFIGLLGPRIVCGGHLLNSDEDESAIAVFDIRRGLSKTGEVWRQVTDEVDSYAVHPLGHIAMTQDNYLAMWDFNNPTSKTK